MSGALSYLAIDIGSTSIRWGAGLNEQHIIKTMPLSDAVLSHIPECERVAALTKDALVFRGGVAAANSQFFKLVRLTPKASAKAYWEMPCNERSCFSLWLNTL